ncbi:hypothetical protein F7725_016874 [Dissostichus mawsoni]|uniref:Uncharacterized protein n=1 Tax=Dissostichus mawsoni TaxID=36200 RepID=A0A7J5Z4V8_DISMA|nr:hypothetical protein F7725_016874 [Dissostichus mawsoni]
MSTPIFTSKGETNTFNSEQSSTTLISPQKKRFPQVQSTSHPQTTNIKQTSPEDNSETTPMATSTKQLPVSSQETSTTMMSSSTEQQSTPVTMPVKPTGTMEPTMSTSTFTSNGETRTSKTDQSATTLISSQIQRFQLNFPSTNCHYHKHLLQSSQLVAMNIYNCNILINRTKIYTCECPSNRNNGANNVNINIHLEWRNKYFQDDQSATTLISSTNTEVSSDSSSTSPPLTAHLTQTSPEQKSETTSMGTAIHSSHRLARKHIQHCCPHHRATIYLEYLKRVAAVTAFLGKQGIAFRGHNEAGETE